MYAESLQLADEQRLFLEEFKNNPIGAAELAGYLMGQNHRYLRFFIQAFGESIFKNKSICERIDFLYDLPELKPTPNNIKMFDKNVQCKYRLGKIEDSLQEIFCLSDTSGRHDMVSLIMLRNLHKEDNVYSIRTYTDDEYSFEDALGTSDYFWNFRIDKSNTDVIEIYGRSDGFSDTKETKSIALLVTWTSNILGFRSDI